MRHTEKYSTMSAVTMYKSCHQQFVYCCQATNVRHINCMHFTLHVSQCHILGEPMNYLNDLNLMQYFLTTKQILTVSLDKHKHYAFQLLNVALGLYALKQYCTAD